MLKNRLKTSLMILGLAEALAFPLQGEQVGLYNQSSMVSCENSWDIAFTADYIYWIWQQDGLDVGALATPDTAGGSLFLSGTEEIVFQTPGYASGFQVGLGCNFHGMDDWRLKLDYTWYENSDSLKTTPGSGQYLAVSSSSIKAPGGLSIGLLLSGDLQTTAKLHFSELDATLQRMFYQGKSLTARYSMGVKALWIDEYGTSYGSKLFFIGENIPFAVPLRGSFQTTSSINSWALGPVFGFQTNWLLGYGLRIEGNLRGSLVYTSYTKLQFTASGQFTDTGSSNLILSQPNHYNTVSPVLETSLGLGWGSYLCNRNLYLDLFVGYDFNIYWDRTMLDAVRQNNGAPGNLQLQGLNGRVGIDF